MGCACKVGQQLSYLQKHYGVKTVENKKTNIRANANGIIKSIITGAVVLLLCPFMIISVVVRGLIKKEPLNISKIFKLDKDVKNK